MADKPKPNWAQAKILYCESKMSRADICAECSITIAALAKAATRHGWKALRQQSAATLPAPHLDVERRGEMVRDALGKDLHRTVAVLNEIPISKNVGKFKARGDAMRSVVKNCRDTFGWDSGKRPSTTINIALLQQAEAVPAGDSDLSHAITVEHLPDGSTKLTQNGKLLSDVSEAQREA